MKILHIITGMQKAAGTSVFCGEICNGLVAFGNDVAIAVVNPGSPDCYPLDSRIKLISISSLIDSSKRSTCSARPEYDLIHIHALWSPILHKVANWASGNQVPIVWSPHGMLTPWAMNNKKCKKLLAWWLYQRWDLKKASLIHATAQSEVEDVRRMGLKNRVVVVPLGVKIDDRVERIERVDGKKTLLFVSRVQRKKGLANLVRAWAKLKQESSICSTRLNGWKVRIVGPDQDNHTAELKSLCDELGVVQDFEFAGPKYGADLKWEYAAADLFVLPTHSENFGSVVIEALAHAVPVITTKGAPWAELEERKCGWWIDLGVDALAIALQKAMALSDLDRYEMGVRGRKLVEERYTWAAVEEKMSKAYEFVCSGVIT